MGGTVGALPCRSTWRWTDDGRQRTDDRGRRTEGRSDQIDYFSVLGLSIRFLLFSVLRRLSSVLCRLSSVVRPPTPVDRTSPRRYGPRAAAACARHRRAS